MATICCIGKEAGNKIAKGATVKIVGKAFSPWKHFGVESEVQKSLLEVKGKVIWRIGPLCGVHWYKRERPSTSSQYVTGVTKRKIRAGSPVVEIKTKHGYFIREARFYETPIGITLMRCRKVEGSKRRLYEVEVMFGPFDPTIETRQIS